jgi:hypothetical protein
MNPEEIKLLIEDAVRRAVRPLEDELHSLRLEIARLKGASQTVSSEPENTVQDAKPEASSPSPAPETPSGVPAPSLPDLPVEVPPERTDFARFLQRGLEQEAQEYTEDKMKDADTKKKPGWNPFKR